MAGFGSATLIVVVVLSTIAFIINWQQGQTWSQPRIPVQYGDHVHAKTSFGKEVREHGV
jgi:hypothetical protein